MKNNYAEEYSDHAQRFPCTLRCLIVLTLLYLSTGCPTDGSNGSDSGSTNAPQYTVGGYVIGLEGSGLVLQNNLADDLSIDANDNFVFPSPLDDGAPYAVTVASHPSDPIQVCLIENESGSINGSDISNIVVTCQRSSTAASCVSGSITYNHDLISENQGLNQHFLITGSIPFTCDQDNNITGSGSLDAAVSGSLLAQCTSCTWSADATINVELSGDLMGSIVTVYLDELWYVGSPLGSGSCMDTCDGGSNPYQYPLIETPIQHTEEFLNLDGYTIESPYMGPGASGKYHWTLNIM